MRKRGVGLPLALGVVTCILLALALWPKTEPQRTVVVAARDLGAGLALAAADLTTATLPAGQAPADALADPAALVGQSLAVVRFAGEPVTARHLGPAVSLQPDERGIAVQVKADTGLAGLLRPGMTVGVVATLAGQTQDPAGIQPGVIAAPVRTVYAKALLEGGAGALRATGVPGAALHAGDRYGDGGRRPEQNERRAADRGARGGAGHEPARGGDRAGGQHPAAHHHLPGVPGRRAACGRPGAARRGRGAGSAAAGQ